MTKNIIIYNNTFYEILTLITKYSLFLLFLINGAKNDAENCINKYFWIIIKKLQSEKKIFFEDYFQTRSKSQYLISICKFAKCAISIRVLSHLRG